MKHSNLAEHFARTLAVVAVAALTLPAAAQTINNGSLTGAVANSGVPPGWTIALGSPDTNDVNTNAGQTGVGLFGATPSPSPNGGTWVGLGAEAATGFQESFSQIVSGFTPGQVYRVTWFASNFGYAPLAYTNPASIQLLVNNTSIGFGALLPLQPGWTSQSLNFTATAASQTLTFSTSVGLKSYIGIDGIAVAVVPEPATALLMLAGALGLTAVRRYRRPG